MGELKREKRSESKTEKGFKTPSKISPYQKIEFMRIWNAQGKVLTTSTALM